MNLRQIDHLINGKTVASTDYFETLSPTTQVMPKSPAHNKHQSH